MSQPGRMAGPVDAGTSPSVRAPASRVWAYRFRATWRRRATGYLTLVVLIGAVGGLAMGSIADARRTQSSFPELLAATHPLDLTMITGVDNPAEGPASVYNPATIATLARVPHVTQVVSQVGLNLAILRPDGAPVSNSYLPISAGNGTGNLGPGVGVRIDRPLVSQGRLADPERVDEFTMLPGAAQVFGLHVGQVVTMGAYSNAQTNQPGFGTAAVRPLRVIRMRLVGVGVPVTSVVEDQVDGATGLGSFTPALTRQLLDCCANYAGSGLVISHPAANLASVEKAVRPLLPKGIPAFFLPPASDSAAKAERSVRPLTLSLAGFGVIAGLAALLIGGQVLGRQARLRALDLATLRALGASPTAVMGDDLIGSLLAIVIGALLAVVVAVGLSPLAPLGPTRPYVATTVTWDWTVLGAGVATLVLLLGGLAVTFATRGAPHRAARRVAVVRTSAITRAVGNLRLPPWAVTGTRFALDPGAGRDTVPVRSAIVGALLAAAMVASALTFGASLNTLVHTPALYGWNWNYLLSGGGGSGDIPAAHADRLLRQDHLVTAWSDVYFSPVTIDGQVVPAIGTTPGARVQPPVLSGHDLAAPGQIVLGAITLANLHARLGQTIRVTTGSGPPVRLRVVGTATMPTVGIQGEPHAEMGTGALLSSQLFSAAARDPFSDPQRGPEGILVRTRGDAAAAQRSLQRMTGPLTNTANFGVSVLPVLFPAEIVNYRTLGTTPAILGGALGAGAATALGLTLYASVRRRRRDLALLRACGFTRRDLAATVACQSSVAVLIGTVIGIPAGAALGRVLWDAFAREINAVPHPTVPVVTIIAVSFGALVLANVVATVPGRLAARTPTALLLRAE